MNSSTVKRFAMLRLYVSDSNPTLRNMYLEQIVKHNQSIVSDPFPNSGFDLFVPSDITFDTEIVSKFVDLQVKSEMIYYDTDSNFSGYSGYLVHPRSSISKTPLMLANHTGIIDSGYRGTLIAAFRWLKIGDTPSYTIEKYTRLVQICHPSLCPIFVELINEEQLSSSVRGDGGFGSTGR
jgi:dUTP pyrophosphatase